MVEEFGVGRAGLTTSRSMPSAVNSARSDSLKPVSANLLAQYSVYNGMPRRPRMELTLTIIGVRPCFKTATPPESTPRGKEIDLHHAPQAMFVGLPNGDRVRRRRY